MNSVDLTTDFKSFWHNTDSLTKHSAHAQKTGTGQSPRSQAQWIGERLHFMGSADLPPALAASITSSFEVSVVSN